MKIQTKETAMKPATPKTEQQPPTLLRKAVFGGVLSFRWGLLFTALAALLSNVIFADEIFLSGFVAGSDPFWLHRLTNNSGSLSMSHVGNWASLSASVAFGSVQLNLKAGTDASHSGYVTSQGHWTDTITINSDDPALLGSSGTAQLIFHLSGSQVVGILNGGQNEYTIVFDGDFGYGGYNGDYTGGYMGCYPTACFDGTHIADLATFTHSKGIIFGAPFPFECELDGGVTPGTGSDLTSLQASFLSGTMTVLDGSGNPVSYRATSSVGSSRGAAFTTGGSYSGFSLTNTVGYQTQLALLGGNASSNEMVTASFVANPTTNAFASDVVSLDSTAGPTNKFVAQMSFDPAAAVALFSNKCDSALLWFNQAAGTFLNAVQGNSDGGATQQRILGAFDPSKYSQLGTYGVDCASNVVWAVLDHHSLFAVGKVITPAVVRWTDIRIAPNGGIALVLSGAPTNQYVVESSTNLAVTNWTALATITLDSSGVGTFTDPSAASTNQSRFYRARQ